MNRTWSKGVACVLLMVGQGARAETATGDRGQDLTPTARELSDRGLQQYEQKQYEASIESFMGSFALSGNAGLLFNVAQAYRLKQDCPHALEYYTRYLQAAPGTALRASVERRVAEMRSCADEAGASMTAPPATTAVAPIATVTAPATPLDVSATSPATRAPKRGPLVWTLRGSAAALIAASGAFAVMAWDAGRDYDAATFELAASEANERYRTDTRWAWTFALTGATCALASYLVGRSW